MNNRDHTAIKVLHRFAWLAAIIGFVLVLLNVTDFSSDNLALMVGIGFLIAGGNIYILSTVFHLMLVRTERSA
jgi:hypothetical protein